MPTIAASALRATTTEVQPTRARETASSASVELRALTAIVLANGLWFIWSNRFIPSQDYPDWIYQGFLFTRRLGGALLPGFSLKAYPVPNSIPTVAMGVAGLAVAPEMTGKLVMSAAIFLFVFAPFYLFKSAKIAERNPVYLVPLLFVFNCWFFFGELSYLIGLGLLFLYAGYILRRFDEKEQVSGWIVFASLLAMFFAHPIPFAIGLLLSLFYFIKRPSRALAVRFVAASAIPTALLVWYAAARIIHPAAAGTKLWAPWTTHQIAGRFLAAFSPFLEFLPWIGVATPGMKLAAVIDGMLTASAFLALGATVVAFAVRRQRASLMLQASAICTVFFLVGGFSLMGWVGPGERFIYPAAWFALCWMGASWPLLEWRWPMLAAKAALAALIVAQILFLDIGVMGVSRHMAGVYDLLAGAKSKTEFCTTYENYDAQNKVEPHRRGLDRLLNNIETVKRLPYYLYVERAESAPIFQVGIFDYHGAGNNEDLCKESR
jgi:hypothetical protein